MSRGSVVHHLDDETGISLQRPFHDYRCDLIDPEPSGATDDCDVLYKVTDYYAPASEAGLLWNDPALGVDWPKDIEAFINARDAGWPPLKDFDSPRLPVREVVRVREAA